jgi:sugar phosphate isomerase/epimerase
MKIGTTSFAFRYQFLDPAQAPSLVDMVRQTAEAGIHRLQICENTRPLQTPLSEWKSVALAGEELGVELHMGMKTTDVNTFRAYMERAEILGSRLLRVVLENEQGVPATREEALRFFDAALPMTEAGGFRLALENYFGIPCHSLAEWCAAYPADRLGFCIDSANSLRKFERLEEVLELLSARPFCWHVKDWKMQGSDVGFTVSGALLGTGDLPLDALVAHIFRTDPEPHVYLENWPPATGNRETDIATDRHYLEQAIIGWTAAVKRWEDKQ